MPVQVFDFASAPSSHDPEIVRRLFRFREKIFNREQDYRMPSFDGMEHDELDLPSTTYFVRYGKHRSILGVSRLTPTKYHNYEQSMIENAFPSTVDGPVPHGEDIWEWSRMGVAPELSGDPDLRRQVVDELVLSVLEVALARKAAAMIGVMPPGLWHSVFHQRGWDVEPLGAGRHVYGPDPTRHFLTACLIPVSFEVQRAVRRHTGIHDPVSEFVPAYAINRPARRDRQDVSE